jgi:streptogramin lyase
MTGMVKRTLTSAMLVSVSSLCLLGTGISAAQAAPITEFTQGVTAPRSLTVGPDGNLWFVDQVMGQGSIGRITPTGQVIEFTQGLLMGSNPMEIEPGPGGDLWFSDQGTTEAIGRITPAGQITEFSAGTNGLNAGASPGEITEGPAGSLWFLDNGMPTKAIGEISKTGVITEHTYSTDPNDELNAITEGPDGNIYFTVQGNNPGLGEVNVASGTVTKIPTGTFPPNFPNDITGGPDGNIWSDDDGATTVSRLTAGTTTVAPFGTSDGLQVGAQPDAMTSGPDGNVWFIDQFSGHDAAGRVTPSGAIKEFQLASTPWGITPGIDGNLWVPIGDMGGVNAIARITPAGTVTPFSAGLSANANFGDGSDITVGPDGNLWTIDEGTPKAIVREDVQLPPIATTGAANSVTASSATIAGSANPRGNAASVVVDFGTTTALGTKVAAGTLPTSDQTTNVSATLPGLTAGTTYDYRVEATNTYGTAAGAIQSFTTAPAPAATTTTTTTTATRTQTAHVGNQIVTLVTPSPKACVAGSSGFSVTLNSTAVTGSHATKLRFRGAAFFLDRGVRRTRTVHKRIHGKLKKVKVVTFTANATADHVPVTESLQLTKLTGKTHKLKVVLAYAKTVKRHGKQKTVTVTKILRSTFQIC